jgi:hypothetical protein
VREGRPFAKGSFLFIIGVTGPHPLAKALEHYEDLADIKRAIVHTNVLAPDVRTVFCRALPF